MDTTCNLLLTGTPGVGKTTVVERVAAGLGQRLPGGFVTREIREQGRRAGFALEPFGGQRRIMAHRRFVSNQRVGAYGVDVACIDYASDLALDVGAAVDLFLVDEIGKMELFSRRFVEAIRRLLTDPRPLVATIALAGKGPVEAIKRRADVELWQVTPANRDDLPGRVLDWLDERT